MSRFYPERPILAASAAVFRDGRVLLATRMAPPREGVFSLPGGVVEVGECLADAARREVLEETGVMADIVGFIGHNEVIERDNAGRIVRHFVVAAFAAQWVSGEGQPGPEAGRVVWADAAMIADFELTPGLRPMLDSARTLLAAHP